MEYRSPVKGGATIFPKARISENNVKKAGRKYSPFEFEDNCENPLFFRLLPNPGDAVLFWDYVPKPDINNHETFVREGSWAAHNASTEAMNDRGSLHGGCPVIEGEKWIATKWIRSTSFD